ncbi:outer membrane lipoprotein LolB [Spongiibacter sp. KMU-158]|uniref:Outer-membrane lipoprotein LolB n=1 Tax=Spongiibacter pelagi TaxID=2760804 RepID=A0A927C017_9GAMM|nr:lipoprotein insertase outer membrane protein LolB [Spongiibacter pelagi]MBD2858750.1 outer membrane lipoprotein LolB [Spongiibacter pelagi]
MSKHLLFIFTLILSGCAINPPIPTENEGWHLRGRIGYWDTNTKESGSIDWQYCDPENTVLKLQGPLGIGGLKIITQPGLATLELGEQQYRAESAEELAARAGWPLPVEALQYWVRGRAAPHSPLKGQMNPSGQLIELEQYGWHIQYLSYDDSSSPLPQKIEATQGSQRLKLIIRDWLTADCQ